MQPNVLTADECALKISTVTKRMNHTYTHEYDNLTHAPLTSQQTDSSRTL